ncbi:MAG: DUF397 domain-containing protein [Pseudonocardiaceae bacterium]
MNTRPDSDPIRPFTKSSYSNGGDNCVEVGVTRDGRVVLRHSKHPELPPHVYTRDEWVAFLAGVKDGEFDL